MSNEIKVGLLLVVAMAILAWLTVASGTLGLKRSEPTRELFSIFEDVDGVKEGSRVKMAGVDVGEVGRVELQPNGTAILRFKVKKSVALPADVSAQITSSGLIGEKYVALVPGASGRNGEGGLLAEGVGQIPSAGNIDPANVTTDFAKMAGDMEQMTSTLKGVLGDPETAKKLQGIIDGLSQFSTSLSGTGSDANGTIQNMNKAAANFAQISEDLRNGKGALGQLLVADGSSTQQNLAGTLNQLNAALADFREIMEKINSGQGTLGRLVNDESTANKLDSALDSVNGLAGGLNGWIGGGSSDSKDVSGTTGSSGRRSFLRAEGSLEALSVLGEDDVYKGSAAARIQAGNTFADFGLTGDGFATQTKGSDNIGGPYYGKDFGSEMKYTAQVGQFVTDNVALRAGLKNSTAGVGADVYGKVPFSDKQARYSADFYDFGGSNTPGNDPHLDLTARADLIGKKVYGIVGYDNVLSDKYGGPMVGVGVRLQTSPAYTNGDKL